VIDNGKVGGAVLRARAAREENELTCRKLESNVSRELSRIANDVQAVAAREKSLASASPLRRRVPALFGKCCTGLISPLEYRVSQTAFLKTKSGLLDAVYQHNVAVAEWDRATGRYFQFSYGTRKPGSEADK